MKALIVLYRKCLNEAASIGLADDARIQNHNITCIFMPAYEATDALPELDERFGYNEVGERVSSV